MILNLIFARIIGWVIFAHMRILRTTFKINKKNITLLNESKTTKNKNTINYLGFIYREIKDRKNLYRCTKKTCSCSIILIDEIVTRVNGQHNHPPNEKKDEHRKKTRELLKNES
jgi:hypothetical protein